MIIKLLKLLVQLEVLDKLVGVMSEKIEDIELAHKLV
jgi:hypothetical protein